MYEHVCICVCVRPVLYSAVNVWQIDSSRAHALPINSCDIDEYPKQSPPPTHHRGLVIFVRLVLNCSVIQTVIYSNQR